MYTRMYNFFLILTLISLSTLSFGHEEKGKMMDKTMPVKSVMEDTGEIPNYQAESQMSKEPQKSGKAYIVRYESPREIYILAPLKSHKMSSKTDKKHVSREMFKVAWMGFSDKGMDYTWEQYSDLFHFVFNEFRYPVSYNIVKSQMSKETGKKEYVVTLAPKGKSHNKAARYFRKLIKVNYLPKPYSRKISWIKENVFYYRSPALEKRMQSKSKYPMWLHAKGNR